MYDIDLTQSSPWLQALLGPFTEIFGVQLQYWWLLLASALLFLFWLVVYRIYGKGNFWSFSLPKKIYLHPSSKLDYATFLLYAPMVVIATAIGGSYFAAASDLAKTVFDFLDKRHFNFYTTSHPFWMFVVVFVGIAWTDFSQFITHLAYHKVPWLWRFHKVHHSAETLTPFTTLRDHPLIFFIDSCFYTVFLGVYIGIVYYFLPGVADSYFIWEASIYAFVFGFLFFLTSHYFVPISFGPLDKIFVSPAYHWAHHIADSKYYNTNYGHIFSFWDILFRTAYFPAPEELINAPLGVEDQHNYQTLSDLYLRPFK